MSVDSTGAGVSTVHVGRHTLPPAVLWPPDWAFHITAWGWPRLTQTLRSSLSSDYHVVQQDLQYTFPHSFSLRFHSQPESTRHFCLPMFWQDFFSLLPSWPCILLCEVMMPWLSTELVGFHFFPTLLPLTLQQYMLGGANINSSEELRQVSNCWEEATDR